MEQGIINWDNTLLRIQEWRCRRCRASLVHPENGSGYDFSRVVCTGEKRHEITRTDHLISAGLVNDIEHVEQADAVYFARMARKVGIEIDEKVLPGERNWSSPGRLLYPDDDWEGFN